MLCALLWPQVDHFAAHFALARHEMVRYKIRAGKLHWTRWEWKFCGPNSGRRAAAQRRTQLPRSPTRNSKLHRRHRTQELVILLRVWRKEAGTWGEQ